MRTIDINSRFVLKIYDVADDKKGVEVIDCLGPEIVDKWTIHEGDNLIEYLKSKYKKFK